MTFRFVRFECGCRGLVSEDPAVKEIVLDYCGGDDDRLGVRIGDTVLEPKKWTPMPNSEVVDLLKRIDRLVVHGYRYRHVRAELLAIVKDET